MKYQRLAGSFGNLLEHYDKALFGLLAPFLAPLFFEGHEPVLALIMTYAILPIGALSRPLGTLFFGWIGDRLGRKEALCYSLLGMAVVTCGMGCLPTSREAPILAPLLLAITRLLQNFFAAGESPGGAIFVLEHTPATKRSLVASFYDTSSIGGILIASGFVTLLSSLDCIEERWRLLFWFGGITGVVGIFLRLYTHESPEFIRSHKAPRIPLFQQVIKQKRALVSVIFASGFSYVIYSLAFTLMNGYIPLVTSLTKGEVMQVNTGLLVVDLLLLPCFGYMAHRFGKEKIMRAAAIGSFLFALPLFALLEGASLEMVIGIRLMIVTLGVAFAAPYHAWAIEQVPPQYRYTILSLGTALGAQFIGTPTAALCLWMYHKSGYVLAPAFYLVLAAAMAYFALRRSMKYAVEITIHAN